VHPPSSRCPTDVLEEEPVEIGPSPGERPSREPQLGQQSTRHDQQRQVESESQAERGVIEEFVEPINGLGRLTQLVMLEAEYRFGECGEERRSMEASPWGPPGTG
jgi:hypothetical protein